MPGRPADEVLNRNIAKVVHRFGNGWSSQLAEISEALEKEEPLIQDGNMVTDSKKWEGKGCTTWIDVCDVDPGGFKKFLDHRLKWVEEHPDPSKDSRG